MSLSHTDPVGDSVGLGSFCLPRGDSLGTKEPETLVRRYFLRLFSMRGSEGADKNHEKSEKICPVSLRKPREKPEKIRCSP